VDASDVLVADGRTETICSSAGGRKVAGSNPDNAVLSRHIKNGQVKSADLAANSVRTGKVADGSLLRRDFKTGQLSPTGPAGGDLAQSYPNPRLRQPTPVQIAGQPPPPAAPVDCETHRLTFCEDDPTDYFNQPSTTGWPYAGLFVDSFGFVHLQGWVEQAGNPFVTAFVLPQGERPPGHLAFLAESHPEGSANSEVPSSTVGIHVLANGDVDIFGSKPGSITSLSGITFHP
jgi:hypothetical protein